MIVGIVGLGLIGGSMGLDLRSVAAVRKVIGFDTNVGHCECARRMKIVDQIVELDQLYSEADIIILATPVNVTAQLLGPLLDVVREDQIVTDTGSSKGKISDIASRHVNGKHFIAGHPVAGTEHSGPSYAKRNLFRGKTGILCSVNGVDMSFLEKVKCLYEALGMRVAVMCPEDHDRHLAYVSHLSHISSFALGRTVLEIEKDEETIFDLAGSGFESTVRLAKSSSSMWNPIFRTNKENILTALSEYIEQLNNFKELLRDERENDLDQWIIGANDVKRVLAGKHELIAKR